MSLRGSPYVPGYRNSCPPDCAHRTMGRETPPPPRDPGPDRPRDRESITLNGAKPRERSE